MFGEYKSEWRSILLFGEQDYASGGGASPLVGVHQDSGEILGLDLERDDEPIFFFNTDVDAFVRSFVILDAMLRERGGTPLLALKEQLEAADPSGWTKRSDWRLLAEHVLEPEDGPVDEQA